MTPAGPIRFGSIRKPSTFDFEVGTDSPYLEQLHTERSPAALVVSLSGPSSASVSLEESLTSEVPNKVTWPSAGIERPTPTALTWTPLRTAKGLSIDPPWGVPVAV